MKKQLLSLTLMSLLTAMVIVLRRFLSIETPIVSIGFSFVPVALAGMLFGPVRGGVVGGAADLIGFFLFPSVNGAFFPGFTLTAILTGVVFGFFLRDVPLKFYKVLIAVLIVNLLLNLGLDSLWVQILTGKAIWVILPTRIVKCALMIPVQVLSIQILCRYLGQSLLGRFRLTPARSGVR